ncbi:MAG: 3D domain-containing protein [Phycisphaerales bacterium]
MKTRTPSIREGRGGGGSAWEQPTGTSAAAPMRWRAALRLALQMVGAAGLVAGVALSAILTKDARSRSELPALVALDSSAGGRVPSVGAEGVAESRAGGDAEAEYPTLLLADPLNGAGGEAVTLAAGEGEGAAGGEGSVEAEPYYPPETKWFNGRAVRPGRTITMVVTAYTPDEISCGEFADGITSSNHSVYTNGMRLVAADSRVLPLGSMISVPGYAEGKIVPVLDRGGKIKGNRLDVLFADNATARKWGKKTLTVTVWEYADGKPAEDWRAIRDSRTK